MVTTLHKRVAKLEESAGGGGECPRCGLGDVDDDSPRYEVVWVDPGGEDEREEFCKGCGRQLVYVVTWGSDVI